MSSETPGLDDTEFERFSSLSTKASLSDQEMDEFSQLDKRVGSQEPKTPKHSSFLHDFDVNHDPEGGNSSPLISQEQMDAQHLEERTHFGENIPVLEKAGRALAKTSLGQGIMKYSDSVNRRTNEGLAAAVGSDHGDPDLPTRAERSLGGLFQAITAPVGALADLDERGPLGPVVTATKGTEQIMALPHEGPKQVALALGASPETAEQWGTVGGLGTAAFLGLRGKPETPAWEPTPDLVALEARAPHPHVSMDTGRAARVPGPAELEAVDAPRPRSVQTVQTPQQLGVPGVRLTKRGQITQGDPVSRTVGSSGSESLVEQPKADLEARLTPEAQPLRGGDVAPRPVNAYERFSGQDTPGLVGRLKKAGFANLDDAVRAVRSGDETAVSTLRPQDVNKLQELIQRSEDATPGGRVEGRVLASDQGRAASVRETGTLAESQNIRPVDIEALPSRRVAALREEAARRFRDAGDGTDPVAQQQRAVAEAYEQEAAGGDPAQIAEDLKRRYTDRARVADTELDTIPGYSATIGEEAAGQYLSNRVLSDLPPPEPPRSTLEAPGEVSEVPGPGTPPEPPKRSSGLPTASKRKPARGGPVDRYIESFRADFPGPSNAGHELSDALGRVDAIASEYTGRATTPANEAFGELGFLQKQEASLKVRDWVKGVEPTPPWAAEFVEAVREGSRVNAENFNASKSLIQDPKTGWRQMNPALENWFTETIDPQVLREWKAENLPGHKGLTPWSDAWARAGNRGNPMRPDPLTTGPQTRSASGFYGGAELPRTAKIPNEMLPKDAFQAITSHWRRTALTAAENEVFNQTRQDPETRAWTKDGGDLQKLYDTIANEDPRGQAAADQAKFRVDRLLDRNTQDVQSTWSKNFNRAASNATTLSKLGGSVMQIVQQPTQLRNTFAEVGSSMAAGIRNFLSGPTESIRQARTRGSIEPDSYLRALDMQDGSGGGLVAHSAKALGGVLQAPQSALDVGFRAITAESTPAHSGAVLEGLRLGGRAREIAERALARYDMPENYKQEFRNGTPSERALTMFEQRLTGFTNVRAGVTEFPRLAGEGVTSPGTRWLRQLKSFQIGDTNFFLKGVLKEATNGNIKPLMRYAVGAVVVGELYRGVGSLTGRSVQFGPSWKETFDKDGLEFVSALGKHLGASAVMGGAPGFSGPVIALVRSGDTNGWDTLVRTILPPAISDTLALGNAITRGTFRKTQQESMRDSFSRGEFRTPDRDQPRNRGDAWIGEAKTLGKRIFPQIAKNLDTIRLWFDDQYRAQEKRATLSRLTTGDIKVRKDQETRYKQLVDIESR